MKDFEIHTVQSADPKAAEIFAAVTEKMGYLPNILAQMGQLPFTVEAFVTLNQAFGTSSFSRLEQEIVQIAASMENNSPYCIAGHTAFAEADEVPMEAIETLRAGQALDDPKLEALAEFTRSLMRGKGRPDSKAWEDFLAAGYTPDQVFEVIMGISFKVFSNFIANVTRPELDEAFAPHEWSATVPGLAAE